MNPLAEELNKIIQDANPNVYAMMSQKGKELYFPKGILSQGAEAKEKAFKYDATIGIATENGVPMHFPSIISYINLRPDESISYASSFGLPELRKTWQQLIYSKNPSLSKKEISLPVVTNAITHGISVTAEMWLDQDDVILIPDKNWGNYNLIFTVLHGVRIKQFSLFSDSGGFNLQSFKQCLNDETVQRKKVAVLLNFPNNPTGYTPTKSEGEAIVQSLIEIAERGKNVLAITDDAYFGLFYDPDSMNESLFSSLASAHPNIMAIKLDGATKENYVWGLRVGFISYGISIEGNHRIFYEALEKKTAGAVRGTISNSSHLSQSIVLGSLNSKNYSREKEEKFDIMKARAKKVKEVLSNTKYDTAWYLYPFNSGYFMCLRLKTVDAEKLRLHLLEKYGVGVISIGETDIRVAFSCVEVKDIPDLFDILYKGVKDLENL